MELLPLLDLVSDFSYSDSVLKLSRLGLDFVGFMIRIWLNVKSQQIRNIYVFSQGIGDSKNLRYETLYIGDDEYVNISSFAVLGIKLWLEENGGLNNR